MSSAATAVTAAEAGRIADDLERAAAERAELDDFGADGYREGLELLVFSVANTAVPKADVRELLHGMFVDALVNRLRLVAYAAAHPELGEAPVPRPLMILGMPRTGTTLLSSLLDQDPHRRSLLFWEAWDSVPPPTTATLRSDPRAVALRRAQEEEIAADPRVRPHHEWADAPAECIRLHQQEFKALAWEAFMPVPDYSRWLMTVDATSAYAYQRMALQVLQSRAPGIWSLKMPSHALHVESLLRVFPDARLVWTHRDPYRALASLFSMKSAKWARYAGDPAVGWLREHYVTQLAEHVNRPLRVRARLGAQALHDVRYAELMRDPIGEIRRLYAWAGDELTPEAEAAMTAWLADNPQGALGHHTYSLEQFGLSAADLEPAFAEYLAAVDVEPEGALR